MGRRREERTFEWDVSKLKHLDIILCAGIGPWAWVTRANTVSVQDASDKGILTHIAIVYELPSGYKVLVEAKGGKGVQIRPLTDYDRHNPFRFAVGIRRLDLTAKQKADAQKFLDYHIANGTDYDTYGIMSFNKVIGNIRMRRGKRLQAEKAFYCSELARQALKNALPKIMRSGLVSPEDFKDVGEEILNFKI